MFRRPLIDLDQRHLTHDPDAFRPTEETEPALTFLSRKHRGRLPVMLMFKG